MKSQRLQQGFTLIELIVVMAILVMLSVISYRALVMALDTRQVVSTYSEQLREFELGLFILSKDLQQIHRAPLEKGELPLVGRLGQGKHTSGELLSIYRAPDAQMLRGVTEVVYYLDDSNQTLWQQVGKGEAQFKTAIMQNVHSASVTFYSQKNRYHTWTNDFLPELISLSIEHQRYGEIVVTESLYGK